MEIGNGNIRKLKLRLGISNHKPTPNRNMLDSDRNFEYYKVSIAALQEVRWTDERHTKINYFIIYRT